MLSGTEVSQADVVVEMLSAVYVRLRQRLPAPLLLVLRRLSPLLRLARRLDPKKPTVLPLSGPLAGHRMRVGPPYHWAMAYGHYEPAVCRVIEQTVRPGWTAVDIGAHIGYVSLLLAKCVGPSGRVFAFEPLPENVVVLRENVALNGYQNIRVESMAVADISGTAELYDGPTTSQATIHAAGEGIPRIVQTCSLDDYLRLQGFPKVDFVKVDVEGAEGLVIAGMKAVLARSQPILLIELHGEVARPAVAALAQAGSRLLMVTEDGDPTPWDPSNPIGHSHCLALPGNSVGAQQNGETG